MSGLPHTRFTIRRLVLVAALAATPAAMWAAAHALHAAGWRLNWTASEPRGIYRLWPVDAAGHALTRGQIIALCPPAWVSPTAFPFYARGTCAGGGEAMVKTVVGVPGDVVTVTDAGVSINGRLVPASVPKPFSRLGAPLPRLRGTFTLEPDTFWVYGAGEDARSAAASFDSRYWGPVAGRDVLGVLTAIQSMEPFTRERGNAIRRD